MDIFVFLSNFLYRIRFKLLFGVAFVAVITIVLTSFIPKVYHATSTIFTGITSKTSVDNEGRADWNTANNAHENILSLIKSKTTLEMVSMHLLAQHLIYGSADHDTQYITAEHYQRLMRMVPPKVIALVDKTSIQKTVDNFQLYKRDGRGNFIYEVFNWDNAYYGYKALSKITSVRKGNSDMIEVNYDCDDPGIAANTLKFLNSELSKKYEELLLSASLDVVDYFEKQLVEARAKLAVSEEDLVQFNMKHNIINYTEQTKSLTMLNNTFEERYEATMMEYMSSKALRDELERNLATRTKLMLENENFLKVLNNISSTNGRIAEIEIFGVGDADSVSLRKYRRDLADSERKIRDISDNIDTYKYSKEGVVLKDMVVQWLDATLRFVRSKAELEVIDKRRQMIISEYETYSPVGPNLERYGREVRIDEESYLTIHRFLAEAKLRQKNILLDAGKLQIVTEPDIPLIVNPRKRKLYLAAACVAAVIFIIGFYLIIELFDRTIRDGARAARLTGAKIIGAFPNADALRNRDLSGDISRISIAYLANALNTHMVPNKPMIINIMSIENGEGKNYISDNLAQYWTQSGFKVKELSLRMDNADEYKALINTPSIFEAKEMNNLRDTDIILTCYEALANHNIPRQLLNEATINLLILDARRVWYPSDKMTLDNLCSSLDKDNLSVYLNFADKEAVEQYTGQLPPYTFLRKLGYRLRYFGITAKS